MERIVNFEIWIGDKLVASLEKDMELLDAEKICEIYCKYDEVKLYRVTRTMAHIYRD